ncbi:hypothetical protein SAMN04489752_1420 [Brevibacterium siliguriense]|uniref:Activator of Hsp90 ATPase homolog 1-like protein n=1 Tax=Brevibacterium siliguriense TaxID=1136497 RepID=A0A1H1R459_9MICO|nr:hypothetical protein [Brevibacterium siliguriense]SDS30482.1 hypothetical protein SAMN04489752_1420 [Brevibacterium siliguriense]
MSETSPRLVTWENGTDLVIELSLGSDVETVWSALNDSDRARTWFAPFRLGEESADAGDEPDVPASRPITFELEDADLDGEVLSCEEYDHVLLELETFGVLGIRLLPFEGESGDETLLVFTHTAPDVESARTQAADFGPMWDTHLRLFARALGLDIAEATESELDAVYSDLALEIADSGDGAASADGTES